MELQAFEHYDYLVFMFKDIRDWLRVLQLLKVAKVDFSISRNSQKIGVGRVIFFVQKHEKNLGGNPTPLGQVECPGKQAPLTGRR